MTRALAIRMMIETGQQLASAGCAGDRDSVSILAKQYLEMYATVKEWKRGRSELPVDSNTELTPRQVRAVSLARDGHRTKDIAQIMGIAVETVKTHLRSARKKSE